LSGMLAAMVLTVRTGQWFFLAVSPFREMGDGCGYKLDCPPGLDASRLAGRA